VSKGENLWTILDKDNEIFEKIPELKELNEAQRSNAIANLLQEHIKDDPKSFGISSNNIDVLTEGDKLDLDKIKDALLNNKISVGGNEYDNIIDRAQGLTSDQQRLITENNEFLNSWVSDHPDTALGSGRADEILGTLEEWRAANPGQSLTHETMHGIIENANSNLLGPPEITDSMEVGSGEDLPPTSEQIAVAESQANIAIQKSLDDLYGSKGLFGQAGEKSLDWKDLKDRSIFEVMDKSDFPVEDTTIPVRDRGMDPTGLDSSDAVEKIKGYLGFLENESGIIPEDNETVEQYMLRANKELALQGKFNISAEAVEQAQPQSAQTPGLEQEDPFIDGGRH